MGYNYESCSECDTETIVSATHRGQYFCNKVCEAKYKEKEKMAIVVQPEQQLKDVNPFNNFVDYITDNKNIWHPEKYLSDRNISGVTETGVEFKFTYTYVLGTAYMHGRLGKDFDKIEVFYREQQGFQVVTTFSNGTETRESFTPYATEQVKDLLNRHANL